MFEQMAQAADATNNPSQRYLIDVARSARDASALVREAWARYKTPVDYGINPVDLKKVAALIDAGMPTRLYYVAYRHNAFDTHVHQSDLHARQLTYVSDAVLGFMQDLERIGRADDVALLIFSEFGRRVPENTSLGTDHGTANYMFLVGKAVKGGHYGTPVSLTRLDDRRQPDPHLRLSPRLRDRHRRLGGIQADRDAARREVRQLSGVRLKERGRNAGCCSASVLLHPDLPLKTGGNVIDGCQPSATHQFGRICLGCLRSARARRDYASVPPRRKSTARYGRSS